MLRHRELANGIYWLETSQCEEMLAVCYPIWNTEFSGMVRLMGEVTDFDRAEGINNTMGYMFFSEKTACAAIFELLENRKEWDSTLIDRYALMNAIWENVPKYAIRKNGEEPAGPSSDPFTPWTEDFAEQLAAEKLESRIIGMFPGKGTDYLKFPDPF